MRPTLPQSLSIIGTAFVLALTLMGAPERASGQSVTIQPLITPPYSPYLSDYLAMTNGLVMVTNNTDQPVSIRLTGEITGPDGLSATTKPGYRPSRPLTLPPFGTVTLLPNTGSFDFLARQNINTNLPADLEQNIFVSGVLPEGAYSWCAQAFDFASETPLSQPTPLGCAFFNINYPEPPILLNPMCGATVAQTYPVFSWSRPTGQLAGAQLRYDLFVVEVMPPRNANESINLAVAANVGNPIIHRDLQQENYTFTPADIPLKFGKTYAVQVVARELSGKIIFQNGGRSEVCTFNYGPLVASAPTPPPAAALTCAQACAPAAPAGGAVRRPKIDPGTVIKAAGFDLTIVGAAADGDGLVNGTATVMVPIINSSVVRLRVQLAGVSLDADNRMVAGLVSAVRRTDASFLPNADAPSGQALSLSPAQIGDLGNYFSSHAQQLVRAGQQSLASAGLELPVGYQDASYNLAVTRFQINGLSAVMEVLTALDLPDAGVSVALQGQSCVNPQGLCGDLTLYLARDAQLRLFASNQDLVLKGADELTSPQDSGTYLVYGGAGLKKLRVVGELAFPVSTLQTVDGKVAKLVFKGSGAKWADFIAQVTMPPFKITGVNDFVFRPGNGFYDHSDLRALVNLPADLTDERQTLWHGFHFPTLQVDLPNFFGGNSGGNVNAVDLVIGAQGASVKVLSTNPINSGDNSAWAFRVEEVSADFRQNAFVRGGFKGKVKLPITKNTAGNQLAFAGVLSYANGTFGYEVGLRPTGDIDVPLFGDATKFTLAQTTSVTLSKGSGGRMFEAQATLNGALTVGVPTPQITLGGVKFEGLALNSTAPYVRGGNITSQLGNPPHQLGGFGVNLTDVSIVQSGGKVGLHFGMSVSLAENMGVDLAATTAFTANGRFEGVEPVYDGFVVDEITVKADLSFMKLNGKVVFYNEDPVYGDGFDGQVQAKILDAVDMEVHVLFGKKSYNYWFVDASLRIEPGITFFPGLDLSGIGGGAYYHMRRNEQAAPLAIPANAGDKIFTTTPYLPVADAVIGFKASIYLAMSGSKAGFNSKATLEFAINTSSGSLDAVVFEGKVNILGGDYDKKDGAITGDIKAGYYHQEKKFQCDAGVKMDLVITEVTGTFSMLVQDAPDRVLYYIKIGTPGNKVKLSTPIVDIGAYFEAGNYLIDDLPPPPREILAILAGGSFDWKQFGVSRTSMMGGGGGKVSSFTMVHGGLFELGVPKQEDGTPKKHVTFGPFYAAIYLGLGYDLTVFEAVGGCNGQTEIGFGGYYAIGQVYAGAKAEIGIHVDIFGISGDYPILEIGAAAVLQAGAINPVWGKGVIGGYYSICGGLVSGRCAFQFSFGTECVPVAASVLEGVKLVEQTIPTPVNPDDGYVTELQEVDLSPSLSTNLPMNEYETIPLAQQLRDGVKQRLFRFASRLVTVDIGPTAGGTPVDLKVERVRDQNSSDPYSLWVRLNRAKPTFDKDTEYRMTVTARLEECSNVIGMDSLARCATSGSWALAKYGSGPRANEVFADKRIVTFKTNKGLNFIKETDVKGTFPIPLMAHFGHRDLQGGVGSISMAKGAGIEAFDTECASSQAVAKARFVDAFATDPTAAVKEVSVDWSDKQHITFPYPPALKPETPYVIQIVIQCPVPPSRSSGFAQLISQTTAISNGAFYNNQTVALGARLLPLATSDGGPTESTFEVRQAKLLARNTKLGQGQKRIYEIPFQTGLYSTAGSKLATMQQTYNLINAKSRASTDEENAKRRPIGLIGTEVSSGASRLTALGLKLGTAKENVLIVGLLEFHLKGPELLDYYDINGYDKVYIDGTKSKTMENPPLLEINSPVVNAAYYKMMADFGAAMPGNLDPDWWRLGWVANEAHDVRPYYDYQAKHDPSLNPALFSSVVQAEERVGSNGAGGSPSNGSPNFARATYSSQFASLAGGARAASAAGGTSAGTTAGGTAAAARNDVASVSSTLSQMFSINPTPSPDWTMRFTNHVFLNPKPYRTVEEVNFWIDRRQQMLNMYGPFGPDALRQMGRGYDAIQNGIVDMHAAAQVISVSLQPNPSLGGVPTGGATFSLTGR